MNKINVGLVGINGHQLHEFLKNHERACCYAITGIDKAQLPKEYLDGSVIFYDTFEELIKDKNIDVVSLCPSCRKDQEWQAIEALKANKHVYSEKPAALSEEKLDEILELAKKLNLEFHEMADTCFEEPFLTMREVVDSGILGEIVHMFAQKSYPYHDRRPQDDITDGGLIRWIGIHAVRFIEHTSGIKVKDIYAVETSKGNPVEGGNLCMASSLMMKMENGGVAAMSLNYLHQKCFDVWGNEHLRIWGTKGFIETVDGCTKTRIAVNGEKIKDLELHHENDRNYFDFVLDKIIDNKEMPISLEDELHPLRVVIRAKNNVID